MKNKTKKMWIGVFLIGALCLTGCGNSYEATSDDYFESTSYSSSKGAETDDFGFQASNGSDAVEEAEYGEETYADNVTEAAVSESGEISDSAEELSKKSAADHKKIIKTYHYSYDTEKFDESYQYLRETIEQYEGYVSSSEVYGTSNRSLSLTARIPADKCDDFVGKLGSLGTVVSQSESAEDVTLQYTDTESRIASLETEQKRLNELLEKAENLDAIITLEQRLTEVRYELENYKSQKNLYDDLITYCTVYINLEEVVYTVPVDDSSIFSRIKTGLRTTFRDIQYDLENFLVWFIVSLPYLIIWGIIIFVVYRIIRTIVRKSKAKRQAKKEKKAARSTANGKGEAVPVKEAVVEDTGKKAEAVQENQTTDKK